MTRRPGLILSSYASAPALDGWDPRSEGAFLSGAAELPGVSGLEIPFHASGELHKYDGGWFLERLRRLPEHFEYVVTTIPDTMDRVMNSAAFGLASAVPAGREAALERAAAASEAVRTLNGVLGRQAVRAVHLFSAPRPLLVANSFPAAASASALADSLHQLAEDDWDGARPVLEHCDAPGRQHPPVKGFLPLEQEIEAILGSGTGAGVALNWARSVIESRDTGTPARHLELALDADLLAGFVLSGCASRPTAFGEAWDDTHLPPAPVEPASLLTPQGIRAITASLDAGCTGSAPDVYRGLKISAPRGSSVEERLALLTNSINTVCGAGF
ncbi:DUF4862 family protein [Pseudarthrobacter oxydans]|uniref:DUF4862 family protein n=1 Tax=Pseudarthrobacter oxydans TaxID=1671 RepID=UPI003D2E5757